MSLKIIVADYSNPQQAQDIVQLLNEYAKTPEGGGNPLSSFVQENLIAELAQLPGAFSLLAYFDDLPIGLINGFTLLATFKCQLMLNIHDVFVLQEYRRQGISQQLLTKVEEIAREKNACRLSLEVLEHNENAKKLIKSLALFSIN